MALITPSHADILNVAFENMLGDFRVAMPGIIKTYDATKQTAEIQLMVKRVLEDETGERVEESFPVLPDVPIVFPRGGGFGVTLPLAAGNNVIVVFCDLSIDQWRAKNKETAPDDLRMHGLGGAIAIPGLYATGQEFASTHATHMVLGKDDGAKIYVKTDGTIHIYEENASQFVALAQKVFDEINALRTTVDAFVTVFNLHVHTGGTIFGLTGTSVASATNPAAVNSVAATHVKAS